MDMESRKPCQSLTSVQGPDAYGPVCERPVFARRFGVRWRSISGFFVHWRTAGADLVAENVRLRNEFRRLHLDSKK